MRTTKTQISLLIPFVVHCIDSITPVVATSKICRHLPASVAGQLVFVLPGHTSPRPSHDKTTVCPAKTQISLGICPVWSEPSLCAPRIAKNPRFLHADSEDSDQTGRMPRLIWVFAGRTCHFVGFVMPWLILWWSALYTWYVHGLLVFISIHWKHLVFTLAMNVVPGWYFVISILCPKSINLANRFPPPNTAPGLLLTGSFGLWTETLFHVTDIFFYLGLIACQDYSIILNRVNC